MRIDDDELLTLDECLEIIGRAWGAIETSVLEQVAADAIAQGFDAADVRLVIEERARVLRDGHADRLETAAAMLKAHAPPRLQ
jgi:hypothetical protein